MNPRQCRRLVDSKILEFESYEIAVRDLNSFGGEVELHGTQRGKDGSCDNGTPFHIDGISYPDNWAIALVSLLCSVH